LVAALNAIPHIRARTDDNRSANDRRRPEFRKSRKGRGEEAGTLRAVGGRVLDRIKLSSIAPSLS
jgi:hypothetical protein